MFTGIMRCRLCHMITADRKLLRNGSLWDFYHCSNPRRTCTAQGMSVDAVDKRIALELSSIKIDQETFNLALKDLNLAIDRELDSSHGITHGLEEARREIGQRLERIHEMWVGGLVTDPGQYVVLQQRELRRQNEILASIEKNRTVRDHMRKNARSALMFARYSSDTFEHGLSKYKRAIATALGLDYSFDGIRKEIHIAIPSVLKEVVQFAKEGNTLVPAIEGSETQKTQKKSDPFLFGGPDGEALEPRSNRRVPQLSANLSGALRSTSFLEVPLLLPIEESTQLRT